MDAMADNTSQSRGMVGFVLVVMFLFGGTVGYIVRDVGADAQLLSLVAEARRESQQTAAQTASQVERAAATVRGGLKAVAESAKAAVEQVASKEPAPGDKEPPVAAKTQPAKSAPAATPQLSTKGKSKSSPEH